MHLRASTLFAADNIALSKTPSLAKVSTALDRFFLQTEQWREWADQLLVVGVHAKVMEAMKLGKVAVKQIEYRMAKEATDFDKDGFPIMSVWVFFNVLTWYITHRAVSLNHRVDLERRLKKAIINFRK